MYILRYLRSTTFGIKGDCLKLGNHKKIGIPTENWDTNRKLVYHQKIGIPPEKKSKHFVQYNYINFTKRRYRPVCPNIVCITVDKASGVGQIGLGLGRVLQKV